MRFLSLARIALFVTALPTQMAWAEAQPVSTVASLRVAALPEKVTGGADDFPGRLDPVNLSDALSSIADKKKVSVLNERGLSQFRKLPLPPEPVLNHDAEKTVDMGPLHSYRILPIAAASPIRLEASYTEPLTLTDALTIARQNNFAIRISNENFKYQKYQFIGNLFAFLPSFSQSWGLSYATVRPIPTSANSRVFQTAVRYPVFAGGSIFYGALAQYYRMKAFKQAYYATVNDALLDVYTKYNNLVLNNAILQIRIKSYQFSQAQLELNNALYKSGTGTQFAIMQSRAQLANDEQAMLQQQAAARQASMALAFSLNLPMAINFVPADEAITENALINNKLDMNRLMNATIGHRPELRQYELFRLVANRQIQQACSNFYPTVSFFTSYTHASTSVYPPGNADQLNGIASGQVAGGTGIGSASNTALNQTASFAPGSNNLGTSGANTTAIVVASGGNPIANTQSGSLVTSGAVAPAFGVNTITGVGSTNPSGANTATAGVFPGLTNTFQAGLQVSWSLPNLGQGYISSLMAARTQARMSMLLANQELLMVSQQVRASYCSAALARGQIDNTAYAVKSATEALRLSTLRLKSGTGTNLELIQAQRDYVTALTAQVQAIVGSNIAQAQLLHDTGLISFDTLTSGYTGNEPIKITR